MEAKYTKLYKDFLTTKVGPTPDAPTYGTQFTSRLTAKYGATNGPAIYSMLVDLYHFHEICYEDLDDFYTALWNTLESYGQYYTELLQAYNTSINMLDGRRTIITRSGSNSGSNTHTQQEDITNKDYALPNKTINNGKGNLSAQNENSRANHNLGSTSNEYSETITSLGSIDVIELKKKYLSIIRDYIREWCLKCADCFLQIYS